MIDLDALEQYAPGQIIPFPSDRLREIAAEVRNCREAWAQMARAKERETERADTLKAGLVRITEYTTIDGGWVNPAADEARRTLAASESKAGGA